MYLLSLLTTFKVSKESILRERASNFPVNFSADEIDFDAGGIAKITCENTSENIVDVDCWPNEVCSYVHGIFSRLSSYQTM